ncbi:calcium-binding mitochondrial carrier protein SCaMC-3 isoform X4 [Bactrocera dorsalis]|uniref:Calcium-binding mitochondrial carrier protein SCaMC-3 isoform X4 n=1 Tax=Bactrocera dorsalis TaxID=27457 RepID=A0A8N4L2X8_BACDO|nr:calcium-binding mitochondrial carrier protein SCaMC-3 isoform X4 [Bactrocera dorsalis]XP_029405522.2 calcium-binding mitochondrial carrier protein SCaMC-3 isoform X4 [Bactrocera dorsalis]XP_029405524.2 calcium-binding mitochondrial carrier protein SCaMC-3 isoform X4 [Bactrocera dorsalis]
MVDKDEDKNIVTNNIAQKQEQNKIAQKTHNLSSTAPTTTTSPSLQHTSNAAASSGASCNQIATNSTHLNTAAATHQAKGHDNTSTFPQFITGSASGAHTQLATELPHEDEERLEKLFNTLDRDGNGRIDIHDLSEALREFGLSSVYAEKFLEQSDINQSGDVGLAEFVFYVREHEKNLRLQFSHLDKNKDGKVDLEELIDAFKDLGIEVDPEEATNLLSRMDQDGSLNISFNEWRDFLLLAPSTDIHDLIKFWRHSTYLDIGEDLNVPDDFTQSEMQTGMWWRHLAAGGIAGAVSRTCTAPLDRIKVYLQVQTHKAGISDSLRYMLNEGGLRSMWRGNGINVLKIAPESAIKFAAYEKIKRLIRGDEKRQMTIGERFMAGAAAGGISQTVIYPMEVLKTRLALRKTGQYKGILDAAKKIYLMEGVRSFYRGYIPNMLGIIPYAGIDLAVYETLKKKYLSSHNTEQPSFLVLLACGSASSTLGQVCSYPLALVRTRLQAQVITKSKQPSVGIPLRQAGAINDDNMFGVFRKILHNEGICGLYRGITPNFIKVLPAVSISYVVYEYSSRALGVNMT